MITPNNEGNDLLPILFVFHGAGGNAKHFGGLTDSMGKSWSDVSSDLSKSGFSIVGGEATQFSGSSRLRLRFLKTVWSVSILVERTRRTVRVVVRTSRGIVRLFVVLSTSHFKTSRKPCVPRRSRKRSFSGMAASG